RANDTTYLFSLLSPGSVWRHGGRVLLPVSGGLRHGLRLAPACGTLLPTARGHFSGDRPRDVGKVRPLGGVYRGAATLRHRLRLARWPARGAGGRTAQHPPLPSRGTDSAATELRVFRACLDSPEADTLDAGAIRRVDSLCHV